MTRNFTLREAALLHEEKHPHGRARSDPTCVKHLVLLAEMTRWFGRRNFEWWFSVRMPQIQKMAVVALRRKHGWSKHPLVCFRFLDMHWECFVIKSAASKKLSCQARSSLQTSLRGYPSQSLFPLGVLQTCPAAFMPSQGPCIRQGKKLQRFWCSKLKWQDCETKPDSARCQMFFF